MSRHLALALVAVVLLVTSACAPVDGQRHPTRPDVLDLAPTERSAADLARYVVEQYSDAVETGRPEALDFMDAAECWYCSPESQVVSMAWQYGGGTRGGGLRDLTVTDVVGDDDEGYEVSLDARREEWTFLDASGNPTDTYPALDHHLIVRLEHDGDAWRLLQLSIEAAPG